MSIHRAVCGLGVCGMLLTAGAAGAADSPSPKLALSFRPVQKDVEYDIPDAKEVEACKVQVEKQGKASGWVVLGPAGQPLRRFVDTNADNVVDQWRYYSRGIEVYRDLDTNFNNKVDQCRWLNTAGSRWGACSKEDGKIDSWKLLSAEELSREAVRALVAGDERAFDVLLLTKEDVTKLGITGEVGAKLLKNIGQASTQFRSAGRSKALAAGTEWMRFDSQFPGVVPADQIGAKSDLLVHSHAMAIVESGKNSGLIQLGEIVRVDDVWKLTRIPTPIEGENPQLAESVFLIPSEPVAPETIAATKPGTPGAEKLQKLVEQLRELDEKAPPATASKAVLAKYNRDRVELMQTLLTASQTDEDREVWIRQMADGISVAMQTETFPNGMARLDKLQEDLVKQKSPLAAYVEYRKVLAEHNIKMQAADSDQREVLQKSFLTRLEKFVADHPKAEDAPEAAWQLGITLEFNGKLPEATTWFQTIVRNYPDTGSATRAAGALRRLDLKGKSVEVTGAGLKGGKVSTAEYRGKVVAVLYWATWCKPCTEDLPQLKALYEEYHSAGFEIIGVNLDSERTLVEPYLREHKLSWPQIFEEGGLDSPPAQAFGIVSLPTMFVADQTGVVVNRSANVAELKTLLPELLKKE